MGWIPGQDPRCLLDGGEAPGFLVEVAEILQARAGIAEYGVDGWLRLTGGEPSDCLADALAVINAELDRLERDDRKSEAQRKSGERQGRR